MTTIFEIIIEKKFNVYYSQSNIKSGENKYMRLDYNLLNSFITANIYLCKSLTSAVSRSCFLG